MSHSGELRIEPVKCEYCGAMSAREDSVRFYVQRGHITVSCDLCERHAAPIINILRILTVEEEDYDPWEDLFEDKDW